MAQFRGTKSFNTWQIRYWVVVGVAAIFLLMPISRCFSQEQKTETWLGILKVGPQQLRLQLRLKLEKDGSYSGAMVCLLYTSPSPRD